MIGGTRVRYCKAGGSEGDYAEAAGSENSWFTGVFAKAH